MSLTKITGQLTDPTTFTNVLYANQSVQRAGVGDATEVLFYGLDGTPTSSSNLIFDGFELGVTGDVEIQGGLQLKGTSNRIEIWGPVNVLGTTTIAPSPNSSTSPLAGPRLNYRDNTMPVYWTTIISGYCATQNVATSLTGNTGAPPNWLILNNQTYFFVNGPYVSFNTTTVTTVNNTTVVSNLEFFPLGAQAVTSTGQNAAGGDRVGAIQVSAFCRNPFSADTTVGILFYPIT